MANKEIILLFYKPEDNYTNISEISYRPDVTEKEILEDARRTWGDIKVIGFEYY